MSMKRRIKWTKAEDLEVIWCHYFMQQVNNESESEFYMLWRSRNPGVRPNTDMMTLVSYCRYKLKDNNLALSELGKM